MDGGVSVRGFFAEAKVARVFLAADFRKEDTFRL